MSHLKHLHQSIFKKNLDEKKEDMRLKDKQGIKMLKAKLHRFEDPSSINYYSLLYATADSRDLRNRKDQEEEGEKA